MKHLKAHPIVLTLLACVALFVGCTTSQQTTGFNTLQTTESIVDTGYSNYLHLVITGQLSTNSVPAVSKAYNDLHAVINTAAVVDEAGTNALLQANITTEAASFATLVATAIANK